MATIEHNHDGINSPRVKGANIDGLMLDNEVIHTENDESMDGIKTFTSIPVLPNSDPTDDNELVRKKYVDDAYPDVDIETDSRLIDSADTERTIDQYQTTYIRRKEIKFNEEDGDITVKFDLKDDNGSGGCFGKIYVNGTAVGTEREETTASWQTYSEDISVSTSDKVQLYVKYDNSGGGIGGNCRNFRLYYTKNLSITLGTVNQN